MYDDINKRLQNIHKDYTVGKIKDKSNKRETSIEDKPSCRRPSTAHLNFLGELSNVSSAVKTLDY